MSTYARILASGMYVPERVISNAYFDDRLGEDVSTWLSETARINNRRWTGPGESTADLAEKAAQQALERAGISAAQIDLLIIATDTPEYISPSTASVVQHRLGARRAGTFDLNTACAGFVTALDVASQYLQASNRYQYILVIGAYNMSKFLDPQDKKTVTLFADGAAGVVLGRDSQPGYLTSMLSTQGQYHDGMGIYGGAAAQPVSPATLAQKDHLLKFVYRFPKTLNRDTWVQMIRNMCLTLELTPQDIDHYLFTQINYRTIAGTLEVLGLDMDRTTTVMHEYGYTGSACIPMALHTAWTEGRVKSGDTIMFVGSGGGLAFAGAAFKL